MDRTTHYLQLQHTQLHITQLPKIQFEVSFWLPCRTTFAFCQQYLKAIVTIQCIRYFHARKIDTYVFVQRLSHQAADF